MADNFLIALIKSFGLHLLIGVVLFAGISFDPPQKPTPKVINVQPIESVAVDKDKLTEQINKIKSDKARKQAAEDKRIRDLEARANQAEQQRKKAEQNIKDLARKTRQSEAEKRAADAAATKAKEQQKREAALAEQAAEVAKKKLAEQAQAEKAAEIAKSKRIAEEKAAQEAQAKRIAKAKQEKEARERKAKAERERREQEMLLQQQMAEEQAAREQAYRQNVLSEKAKYEALIKQRIDQVILKDESMKGKSCRVEIKLAFNGLVTSVKILDGDSNVCRAAEAGIYKAGKLPVSEDPTVFAELKNITITYIPDFK